MGLLVRAGTFQTPGSTGIHAFDTGLGTLPAAVLLYCSGSTLATIQQDNKSSFGASDGANQWASSAFIPFSLVDSPGPVSKNAFSAARIVGIIDNLGVLDIAASLGSFNSDGTISLNWTVLEATASAVSFVAFANCDADCNTVVLDPSLAGPGAAITVTCGFEMNVTFLSGDNYDEAGNTNNWCSNGFGYCGEGVRPAGAPGNNAGLYTRNNNTNFDVLYQTHNGDLIFQRIQWNYVGGSTTATGFDLDQISSVDPALARTAGYLSLGGADWFVDGDSVVLGREVLGGIRLMDEGGNFDGNNSCATFSAYDDQDNQWSMCLYGRNDTAAPQVMRMARVHYDDRILAGLVTDTLLSAYKTVDAGGGCEIWPVETQVGLYGGGIAYQDTLTFTQLCVEEEVWKPQIIRHHAVRR